MEKYNYLSLMDVTASDEPLYYPAKTLDSIFIASDLFDYDVETPVFCFEGKRGTGRTEAAKAIARINNLNLYVVDNTKLHTLGDVNSLFDEISRLFSAEGAVVLFRNLDSFDPETTYYTPFLSEDEREDVALVLCDGLSGLQYDKFPNDGIVIATMQKCNDYETFTNIVSFEYDDQDLLHIMKDYWDYKKNTVDSYTRFVMDGVDEHYKRIKERLFNFYLIGSMHKTPARAVAAIRAILSFRGTETADPELGLLRNLLFRAFSEPFDLISIEMLIEDYGWLREDIELFAVTEEELEELDNYEEYAKKKDPFIKLLNEKTLSDDEIFAAAEEAYSGYEEEPEENEED